MNTEFQMNCHLESSHRNTCFESHKKSVSLKFHLKEFGRFDTNSGNQMTWLNFFGSFKKKLLEKYN